MKKNFIIYIFIIFLLSSFNLFAEREVDIDKIKYDEKKELGYVEGEKEPFTGIAKEYYPSGKIETESFYANGKLNGKSITYYENGNLKYEENYKNSKLDGLIKTYFEDGTIRTEIYYKNGELDGLAKEYYGNGQVFIQESYKNGELDGESLRERYTIVICSILFLFLKSLKLEISL